MTSRSRNLAFTAGAVLLMALLWWAFLEPRGSGDPPPAISSATPSMNEPAAGDVTPAPAQTGDGVEAGPPGASEPLDANLPASSMRRSYAIALHELEGLPSDIALGARIELWVAWDPPISEEPAFQLLLKDVIVENIIQPVVPEGSIDVLLSVPLKGVSDLHYGDRYGNLHVAIVN